jgi:hypothetical protein
MCDVLIVEDVFVDFANNISRLQQQRHGRLNRDFRALKIALQKLLCSLSLFLHTQINTRDTSHTQQLQLRTQNPHF